MTTIGLKLLYTQWDVTRQEETLISITGPPVGQ